MPLFDSSPRARIRFAVAGFAVVASALLAGAAATATPSPTTVAVAPDAARSTAAFLKVAAVLRHPRCINCHTVTDFPRQGDAGLPHRMRVKRGPENHGAGSLKCLSCHRDANQPNGIPGAPHWGLAPLSMGWEGLDDHQLAEALKDRAKNGDRDFEKLYQHLARDPLVAWAWAPGGKRAAPPVSHEEFTRHVREWIDTGAFSPPAAK